jgi:putative DNA primase/helicase
MQSLAETLILPKLDNVKRNGAGWMARCPRHEDAHNSLSITDGDDGRILLRCFAGCEASAIVAALGLAMSDLFPRRGGGSLPDRFSGRVG